MAIRYVNLSESATDISGTQGYRLRLNFPASGGIQGVDATGAVFSLVTSTGSIIPAADNADDLGSAALEWRNGYFGSKVFTPTVQAGGPAPFTNASLSLLGVGTGGVNVLNSAGSATVFGAQNVSSTFFGLAVENAAASTAGGSVTINAVSGRFRLAIGGAGPFTITNNRLKDANSIVILALRQIDATTTRVVAEAGVGAFTVTLNAAPTAALDVDFIVINRAV